MRNVIANSIEYMWKHLDEEITLDDMAAAALFSRFYFSRVFRSITGTSPGRFLTAIRIARSKELLATTDYSVAEVACSVGYDSLGTFTTTFSKTVGIAPAAFRRYFRNLRANDQVCQRQFHLPGIGASTSGVLKLPDRLPGDRFLADCRTYVAVFKSPIPRGLPWACAVVDGGTEWQFAELPEGKWHSRAITVARVVSLDPWQRRPLLVGEDLAAASRRRQAMPGSRSHAGADHPRSAGADLDPGTGLVQPTFRDAVRKRAG